MWVQSPWLSHKINIGAQGWGQNPSPQRAGIMAGLVWTLGGGRKRLFISVNAERGGAQMEEYCVYPSDGWDRLVQSNHWTVLYLSHTLQAAADTGNRGRQGAGLWHCLLMSRERSVLCEDSQHRCVFALMRVCSVLKTH